MKNKIFCPLINSECMDECVFKNNKINVCNANMAMDALIDLSCLIEDDSINVNASLYEGD